MRKLYTIGVFTVIIVGFFWAGWRGTVGYIPIYLMSDLEKRFARSAGGENVMRHIRTFGPQRSKVPRANPDSIVSYCVFDLSEGPVRVKGNFWPVYSSVALYAHNTDNFFVLNNLQAKNGAFDLTIIGDANQSIPDGGLKIVSPSNRGLVLIRRFVPSKDMLEAVHENENTTTCEPA